MLVPPPPSITPASTLHIMSAPLSPPPGRLPRSLLAGLMWFDPDRPETVYKGEVRHAANQGDGLNSYGWLRHDGVRYGVQHLIDREYNITLSMVGGAARVAAGCAEQLHALLCTYVLG
jgi:hypothetical protein